MVTFHILTIFPDIFSSYFNESILKRAQKRKIIKIKIYNIRNFAKDKHKTVDDRPYGGGAGMVMKVEPIVKAIGSTFKFKSQSSNLKIKVILLSSSGKQFNQKMARNFAKKYEHIILICGHYEGIDARLPKIIRNWKLEISELSACPYILTGGELPAMAIIDAISRHIPGILGKTESLEEIKGSYPVYTRPEVLKYRNRKYRVPKILLLGDHKKISEWRKKYGKILK